MSSIDEDQGEMSLTLRGRFRRRVLTTLAHLVPAAVAAVPRLDDAETVAAAAEGMSKNWCLDLKAPMRDVTDKVCFITGGSSGIGLGVAKAFAAAGMKVVIGYRTELHLSGALSELNGFQGRVRAIRVDVTNREEIQNAAKETIKIFGKVHVLVNNAGVLVRAPLSRTTCDDWAWLIGVNLTGVFNGVRAFLPHIQDHGEGGQIISISSIAGLLAESQLAAYSVSKFGVVGMMEALREEVAGENIGVSVCCPGAVKSNLGKSDRNRPRELPETSELNQTEKDHWRRNASSSSLSIDPLLVGRSVLRGMRKNDLYILTHQEYEPIIRRRNDAIIDSIPDDMPPTRARIDAMRRKETESMYTRERLRRSCATDAAAGNR